MRNEKEETPAAEGVPGLFQEEANEETSSASIPPDSSQKKVDFDGLHSLPATSAYLNRVGAEPTNFKSACIRTMEGGYPKVTGWVRFDPKSGAVTVSGDVEPPTEAEATAIAEELKGAKFPHPVALSAMADAPKGLNPKDDNVFVFHDFQNRIVMLQERVETPDGKMYIPWTRWSDGKWRKMEPEDHIPFYGLPGAKDHSVLFIHEGPKAPRKIKKLVSGEDVDDRFPWLECLRWGHHVGWIGGYHSIDRSDWVSLSKRNWSTVYIVPDNDGIGKRAAQKIAKLFRCKVRIICFDERFPLGFDLDDEWPIEFFDALDVFVGPSPNDCAITGTQATVELPPEGRGRPSFILRDQFAEEVACTVDGPKFMFRDKPSDLLSEAEFNAMVAPFSHVQNTAAKVLQRSECQHRQSAYHPGHPPGTMLLDGKLCWNCYQPPNIKPLDGCSKPWTEFLVHLFPEPNDRAHVERWLATLIAKPDVRIRYGLLLISQTQGVGKNTLANVLKKLLGSQNVSFPAEKSVTESQFNGWLARKRLVFVAEIYSGASRAAYDKIKSAITDDYIEVNEKHEKARMMENWAAFILASNSPAALYLDSEDRRTLVPTVTEKTKPVEWWVAFYQWLEGDGAGIILKWAQDYVAETGFVRTGDRAPMSTAKQAIIEGSRSEGIQIAHDLISLITDREEPTAVTLKNMRSTIASQRGFVSSGQPDLGHRHLERSQTILSAIRNIPGIHILGKQGGVDLRPRIQGVREVVLLNFDPADKLWPEIRESLETFENLGVNDVF